VVWIGLLLVAFEFAVGYLAGGRSRTLERSD
jgi:hypothetical protein